MTENHHPTKLDSASSRVIILLLISAFAVILNETFMTVALPRLMRDLDITASTGQWLTTAFLLTMAVVIPVTGMLMNRFGVRKLYILAMSFFITGTAIGAAAIGFWMLVLARIIQAFGTAIMMPLLMTTIMTLVPPMMRGRIMGRVTISMSVAPALGPAISGLILSVLSWHWLFILMLPIAITVTAIGVTQIKSSAQTENNQPKIDLLSILLTVVGFGGTVYGLNSIGEIPSGGSAARAVTVLAVGLLGLGAFIWRQKMLERTNGALLDLRTFAVASFSRSVLLIAVSMMAFFGALLVIPIFSLEVLKLDTLAIGLMLLPGGLIMGLLGPPVGRLFDRFGARPLLVLGTALVATGFWGMSFFTEASPVWLMTALYIVLSIGLAFLFTPLFAVGLGGLPPKLYGYGSATFSTAQQLAGAAGTTLFTMVLAIVGASVRAGGATVVESYARGSATAFLVGAVLSTIAFALAFTIKQDAQPDNVGHSRAVSH